MTHVACMFTCPFTRREDVIHARDEEGVKGISWITSYVLWDLLLFGSQIACG